ncbi:dehydrogenase/reductase SDR family member 11 isoform X1 [Zootoca vivipara]|uniref:dehydrogenase/reductase SDR family member 11 isoform X1 n=1 Tax=Zootoca vivipara TaxID=8524 RepID=UPI00293BD6F2|nr:dehydrogenase/reductase SDR family member 11 isoform X1 [Zootoca vivipara]
MERWKGRVALVTGASVGIGAAVARALVQHGMTAVGCARSVDKIEKLAAECQSAGYPGTLIPYKCDLSVEEEILSMFSAIKTLHQGVDVCINNAGLARPEPLLSGKTEGWRTMIDVNVMAVSICTREAYQSMKERSIDDGHIININSMNGHSVVPQSVVHFYSATKYAVTALTEGLRQELREAKTHIRATPYLQMLGTDPGTFCMQSRCCTTEPFLLDLRQITEPQHLPRCCSAARPNLQLFFSSVHPICSFGLCMGELYPLDLE